MPTIGELQYTFQDNNGKKGTTGLWLPATNFPSEHEGAAISIAAPLAALSNAALVGARLSYPIDIPASNPPEISSNVYRRMVLVFTDGSNYGLLSIPSGNRLYTDLDGDYRSIRITRERLLLLGMLPALESALGDTYLQWGEPFPSTYSVGAITELI